ncbi:MAG: TatD family hydrolase [candidate division NC10 bacterium]|nr:TatD family hydrolase [candidate division NC10 bacterium]
MLVDAHAHLDEYPDDVLEDALGEIEGRRILTVSTAMDISSYERSLQIAARCPWVIPTFGIHPWKAPEYAHRLDSIRPQIAWSPMLGEIGLDHRYVEEASRYSAQRVVFEFFLAEARARDTIVNLHTSGAEAEVLPLLDRYAVRRAIVHWYDGPLHILRAMAERGFYFTVGVEVLYSPGIRAIAREIPSRLLLTETDNPGGLKWLTGRRGMPSILGTVVERLAEVRGKTLHEMTHLIHENFTRLVQNDPGLLGPPAS